MRHIIGTLAGLALVGTLVSSGTEAAEPDPIEALRQDVETLKQNQRALQRDLQEIKALLRRLSGRPADPENVFFRVDGRPTKGKADAPVTLIEFSDYQCPYCARYTRETLPQVLRHHVDAGEVRYVFMNFPLEALHKEAFGAAEAAACAGDQNRYWEMHDRLFTNQDALAAPQLTAHATSLGLDVVAFEQCLATHRHLEAIRRDFAEGEKAGVRGTPSFFLGVTEGDGVTVKAVKMITGAHPYATFKEAIEGVRAAQKK